MKSIKNEQGYALLVVLFVVTVFMILSLSFMGQAFSSTKQNQIVEKRTQSVSAAEMGISYYQVQIQKLFESKQSSVNTAVSGFMKTNPSGNFKSKAAEEMAAALQHEFPPGSSPAAIPIDGRSNASFAIRNFTAVADTAGNSKKVKISFNIIGNENGKETTLFTEMYIDLDSILNLPTSGQSNNYVLPNYNNIIEPTVLCSTLSCNPVYINGPGIFDGNNLLSSNQTIYTKGSLTLTGQGNENNTRVVKIHADGPITIGKNMNSQTNLQIETNDSATFEQNLKVDTTSSVLVRKSLTVKQHLDISNESFVYVGETATVNYLDISSSSKMCVYGDLKYSNAPTVTTKNGETPSALLVYGTVNKLVNGVYQAVTNSPYKVDYNTFSSKCGTYVPPEFQIYWGENLSTVISNVVY
ncbi:hypothetical protein V7266_17640 [Neobacillus drentensis]|uniref:hypothetical protein n=1 Tax=Neobacillus drentensis TaxID=220684 RepID=UPI002FFEEFFF